MIILYHNGTSVLQVTNEEGVVLPFKQQRCAAVLFEMAETYTEDWLVWCQESFKTAFKAEIIREKLHHKGMMISQSVSGRQAISHGIDYIEESPFMKVKSDVTYPTWMMHSDVGAIHAQVVNQVKTHLQTYKNFDFFLNALAKSAQPQGLHCYRAPLIQLDSKNNVHRRIQKSKPMLSRFEQYRFVKEYYKTQWVFFLFLSEWIYEKRFAIFPLFFSLFNTKKQVPFHISQINVASTKSFKEKPKVDVIIPTMGRASFLHDVLKDMRTQTYLPKKVIIVEQDADPESQTQLAYIKEEDWPFEIIHRFIHETGACNARNIALEETDADWVFFADDDNRLDHDTIEKMLFYLKQYGATVLTSSYLQKGEQKVFVTPKQWTTFGSGNSFVRGDLAKNIHFDTAYEHGYGEDTDYGMQLRNVGADILYHPGVDLLHLKAPIGGFRKKMELAWGNEPQKPKPSPTVMLYRLRHTTNHQLKGYKLRLFLRQLKAVKSLNIFAFIKTFKAKWNTSVKWATYLDRQ